MTARLRLCFALLATNLVMISVPAAGQTEASTEAKARALTLAKILNSESVVIGNNEDDEQNASFAAEIFGSKEDLAKLDARYPGVSIEIFRATLPTINRHMKARLPDLWKRQAALYEKSLTVAHLDRLIDFYGSPTGQKMVAAMFRHIKPTAILVDAKSSETMTVTSAAALKDIRRTVPDVLGEMNEAEKAQLIATFSYPGLAARMQSMASKTQQVFLDWMDESAPGEDDELAKIAESVIERRQKSDVK